MNDRKKLAFVFSSSILVVLIMSLIEGVFQPGYLIKSLCKVVLMLGSIVFYSFHTRKKVRDVIHLALRLPNRKLVFFVLGVYLFILAVYFIFKSHIDLSSIKESLLVKEHLSKANYLLIFGYIAFVNSFLEEIFFRGFISGVFKETRKAKLGYLYSALLFALYHIGIVSHWFHWWIYLLCILGLVVAGGFLQWITEKNDNILASYLTHAAANLAINTIGILMMA